MNTLRHQRRLLLGPAFWLLVPFCALAFLAGPSSAETLRTELYQFQLPGAPSGQADPQVYMRVSNADRLISDPAAPLEPRLAEGTSHFALFEFFLGPDQSGLSLSRVRFHASDESPAPFSKLHAILSSGVAGLLGSPAEAEFARGSFSLDLPRVAVRSGGVVGLMFELAPSESVDTLIDSRISSGSLCPEVEVRFPGGGRLWARRATPAIFPSDSSPPNQSLVASCGLAAALIVPTQIAAVITSAVLPHDTSKQPCGEQLIQRVTTHIPRGVRAREPPRRCAVMHFE